MKHLTGLLDCECESSSFVHHHLNKFCGAKKKNRFSVDGRRRASGCSLITSLSFTFVVNLSISVDVCFPDHLIHFLVRELFSKVSHDVTQLCGADEAVAVLDDTR